MSKNLLNKVSKRIGFMLCTLITLVFVLTIFKDTIDDFKLGFSVKAEGASSIIKKTTSYIYNDKMPSNISKIITEGKDGLVSYDENDNEIIEINMIPEIIEKGTGKPGIYSGHITGYGPDCSSGCTGYLACRAENGSRINLYNSIYYNDDEFGLVRILAAALVEFPCGTILTIDDGINEPFVGIILDTGGAMKTAYKNGDILIDVAFETSKIARKAAITNRNGTVQFSVQRWGF